MTLQDQIIQELTNLQTQLKAPAWSKALQGASSSEQTLEAGLEGRVNNVVSTLQKYNPVTQNQIDEIITRAGTVASGAPNIAQAIILADDYVSIVKLSSPALLTPNQQNLVNAWYQMELQLISPAWKTALGAVDYHTGLEADASFEAADEAYEDMVNNVLSGFVAQMAALRTKIDTSLTDITNAMASLSDVSSVLTGIGNVLDVLAQVLSVAAKF